MLGGQPNHGWQLCFPLKLHAGGSDFRLYGKSGLKDLSIDKMVGACCFGCLSFPTGFTCWIFLLRYSGLLLLSPYLCFISLLYLDLYDLGDDALISLWSSMQTKLQCVLIHI